MKKLLIFLFVVIVAAAIFISTINLNKYIPAVEKIVYSSTGYEINIKKGIHISVFPLGVKVSSILIKNPKSFYKNDIATIGAVYVAFNPLSAIFGKGVKISGITIKDLKLYIVKNKEGFLNILPLKKKRKDAKNSSSKGLFIKKITFKNAYIEYRDLQNKKSIYLSKVNLKAKIKKKKGEDIYKNIDLKGDITFSTLKINRLVAVSGFKADFSMKNGLFDMNPIKYKFFGSKARGSFGVDFESGGLTEIKQKIDKLNLEKLSAALYKKLKLKGFLRLNLDIYFDFENTAKTLNGAFVARGKNIVVIGKDLDRIIDGFQKTGNVNTVDIGSFFIVGPLGILADKAYSAGYAAKGLESGKTYIKRLFVKVKIKEGKGYLSDVAFSTRKNRIAAKGVLNFITSRYEDVRVAVLNKAGCAVITQRIDGSFSHPKVEVGKSVAKSIINKISSFFGKLEKAVGIKKSKCKVFYNGVVKQP